MSTETVEQITDMPLLALERWATVASAQDRKFWIALGIALLLHMSLLIGVARHAPRQLGDANGSDDGISISVVTEADLQSKSTVGEEPQPPPGAPPVAAEQPPPPEPPKPDAEPVKPEPEPQAEPLKPAAQAEQKAQEAIRPSLADDLPELLTIPTDGTAASAHTKPQPHDKPAAPTEAQVKPAQKRVANLDLSPPASALNAPVGGRNHFSGATRPAGITRSGANDDFARKAIGEMARNFPNLNDVRGRVLVRIIIDQNGNISDVKVLQSSNNSRLDQSVVFSIKQGSYPFPPPSSPEVDRTFFITYIY